MHENPQARLTELGLVLPEVSPPKGAYIPAVRSGGLVYVSGQVPMVDGEVTITGKLGEDVTVDQGRELSRRCALAALAAVDAEVGLDRVRQVVKVVGYVASAPSFTQQASVIDGASSLLADVFGESGRHARTSIGVAVLPLGAPVEVELVVEVEA